MIPRPALGRREVLLFSAFLVDLGAGWGATRRLRNAAVGTGYGPIGGWFDEMLRALR